MINNPLVTILITGYNSNPFYLNEAVRSALNQDYPNLEVLVVDDGSRIRLDTLLDDGSDPRLRYVQMEHKGLPFGLVKGVEDSRGEYIVILDHDDVLTEGSVTKRVNKIVSTGVGIVYGNINYIDESGKIYSYQEFRDYPSLEEFIDAILASPVGPLKHSGVIFSRRCALQVGNYDNSLQSWFDNDLIIRIARDYGQALLPERIVNYRTHPFNATLVLHHRISGLKPHLMLVDRYIEDPIRKIKLKTKILMIDFAKAFYEIFSNSRSRWVLGLFGKS